ncbi:hypothetical protein JCM25156A_16770 [Komagataeibacter kakiaceti JCM 25156]
MLNISRPALGLAGLLALCTAMDHRPARAADTALAAQLAAASGRYATDTNLFAAGPLSIVLKQELGPQYADFVRNMQVASPLQPVGDIMFMTGNRQHEGGSSIAWLLVDRTGHNMTAGMVNPGQLSIYGFGPTPITKPGDVRTLLENMGNVPPFCNPPQDLPPGATLQWRATLEHGATCIYRIGLHRGEKVTARLEATQGNPVLRVIDPRLAQPGDAQAWLVLHDDLYLLEIGPGPSGQAAQPFGLTVKAD